MAISPGTARGILAWLFTGAAYARPASFKVGIGFNGAEVSGGGYERQGFVPRYADGAVSNVAEIDFGVASASWGKVGDFLIFDGAPGGQLLATVPMIHSYEIGAGDRFKAPAGTIVLQG